MAKDATAAPTTARRQLAGACMIPLLPMEKTGVLRRADALRPAAVHSNSLPVGAASFRASPADIAIRARRPASLAGGLKAAIRSSLPKFTDCAVDNDYASRTGKGSPRRDRPELAKRIHSSQELLS